MGLIDYLITLPKRFSLYSDGTLDDILNQIDYTIGRGRVFSNERDHYLYTSRQNMKALEAFGFGCLFGCTSLWLVGRPYFIKQPLFINKSRRLNFAFIIALTGYFLYNPTLLATHIQSRCNLEDNYFSTICREIIRNHPEHERLQDVIKFNSPDVKRDLIMMPNFRYSGMPAILTIDPDSDVAVVSKSSVPLDHNVFYNDAFETWKAKKHNEAKKVDLTVGAESDIDKAMDVIASLEVGGNLPPYFLQFFNTQG